MAYSSTISYLTIIIYALTATNNARWFMHGCCVIKNGRCHGSVMLELHGVSVLEVTANARPILVKFKAKGRISWPNRIQHQTSKPVIGTKQAALVRTNHKNKDKAKHKASPRKTQLTIDPILKDRSTNLIKTVTLSISGGRQKTEKLRYRSTQKDPTIALTRKRQTKLVELEAQLEQNLEPSPNDNQHENYRNRKHKKGGRHSQDGKAFTIDVYKIRVETAIEKAWPGTRKRRLHQDARTGANEEDARKHHSTEIC
ncbi:hypothetical protein CBL_07438 [Carabus blaptoides fortunei]